jgi:hypothetical protein
MSSPDLDAGRLLYRLNAYVYGSRAEIYRAIEDGFRVVFPEPPAGEMGTLIKQYHLLRVAWSLHRAGALVGMGGSLSDLRQVSEAEAVRLQLQLRLGLAAEHVKAEAKRFDTNDPDVQLVKTALDIVRRHHCGPRRWPVRFPQGDYELALTDGLPERWLLLCRDHQGLSSPVSNHIAPWELDTDTAAVAQELWVARWGRFDAAVCMLVNFGGQRGIAAATLQHQWDDVLATRIKALTLGGNISVPDRAKTPSENNPPALTGNQFELEGGDTWRVHYADAREAGRFQERTDGHLGHLAMLLAAPYQQFQIEDFYPPPPGASALPYFGRDDGSDSQAMQRTEARMRELAQEIKDAKSAGDTETAERLEEEFRALADHARKENVLGNPAAGGSAARCRQRKRLAARCTLD